MSEMTRLLLDVFCWSVVVIISAIWGPIWLTVLIGIVAALYILYCIYLMVILQRLEAIESRGIEIIQAVTKKTTEDLEK